MAEVQTVVNTTELAAYITQEGPKVLTVYALQIVNAAKRMCPVDTGRLRDSITWELGLMMGLPTARIGTNVEYAPYVELGTRYMAAQAFLRPALLQVVGSA